MAAALDEQFKVRLRAKSDPSELARRVAEELHQWPSGLWLVIDDYHLLMHTPQVEEFCEALLLSPPIQAIVASRRRPTWASARRLIYGEVHEIGQSALAMNHDEASEVLAAADRGRLGTSGIVALADGWPAIIGLAANAERYGIPTESVPTAVYDFFAQELFEAASPNVQRALIELSFPPTITQAIANELFGNEAEAVLAEGCRLGFLLREPNGLYVMHSLVREFLRRQSVDEAIDAETVVETIVSSLLTDGSLNDLFLLCREFPEFNVTRDAADAVLEKLLAAEDVARIGPWIDLALANGLDSAAVDLGQAELAFRDARYAQAEALALRSSRRFADESPLISRALFRAGMSAYHENRPGAARSLHHQARASATTTHDRLQALWGELNVALELNEDPTELLAEFEAAAGDTATNQLRLGNARLMAAYRRGGIAEAVDAGEALLPLLERVRDPMVASAFLHALAHSSVLAGRYDAALDLAARQVALISTTRLKFALPHILITKASANGGRRNFAEANRDLSHVEQLARDVADSFILSSAAIARVQLCLLHGDPERALNEADRTDVERSLPALQGELLATRALAAAGAGDVPQAQQAAASAAPLARSIEAREFLNWANSATVLTESPSDNLRARFSESLISGCKHAFVCAYRVVPSVLDGLAKESELQGDVRAVVSGARDEVLGRRAGLPFQRTAFGDLSPRETEVFGLLAEGLTNRQIASRLFISEVTVKVHVRRIFDKTGARSRSEAAVAAARYLADRD